MDENSENKQEQTPETPTETEEPEVFSLTDAISGIFTEPTETFTSVKNTRKRNFWLIPVLAFIVLAILSQYMITKDDELYSQIQQKQTETVKKKLDEQVKDGKISRDDADKRLEMMDKQFNRSGPFFYLFLIIGPVIFTFLILFLKGLIFWGTLKIFKGAITYMQTITVLGLVMVIDSLQRVINTVLEIIMGRVPVNIGPVLIFAKDSLNDKLTNLVAHFDFINIWILILTAFGFEHGYDQYVRVSGSSYRLQLERLAAGLRGLRGRWCADRGGAPQAVLRCPARRGRKGASGCHGALLPGL